MAIFFTKDEGGAGAKFGAGLGEGLSSGLQAIANMKMNEYAQRQQHAMQQKWQQEEQGPMLKQLFGEETGTMLAKSAPAVQQLYIKDKLDRMGNEQLANAVGDMFGGRSAQPTKEKFNADTILQNLPQFGASKQQQNALPGQPEQISSSDKSKFPSLKGMRRSELKQFVPLAIKANQHEDKMKLARDQFEESKKEKHTEREIREAKHWNKESKPDYETAKKKAETAQDRLLHTTQMRELVKEGNLTNPVVEAAFDTLAHGIFGIGIDLKSLLGADSEVYRKLATDMTKGVSDIYKGRLTNTEFENFLKTIPQLLQTDEGKMRIMDNMDLLGSIDIEKYKIMQDIMEKNNGYRPKNFDALVEREMKPVRDHIADEFTRRVKEDRKRFGKSETIELSETAPIKAIKKFFGS